MVVSRSEGYRATATTISTRYVLENAGAAADGSRISATLPANATGLAWTCTAQGMQCPQASGSGAITQTVASWPSSAKLIYDLSVTSPLATTKDLVATMQVTPPQGASCGPAGAPPPCMATQPLQLDLRLPATAAGSTRCGRGRTRRICRPHRYRCGCRGKP
jgi:hypothetical protein